LRKRHRIEIAELGLPGGDGGPEIDRLVTEPKRFDVPESVDAVRPA
jgi:hypothetical protein